MLGSSRLVALGLLATLASMALPAGAALACAAEPSQRWVPQRSWPAACEPEAFTDGVVLLDGDAIPEYSLGGQGDLEVSISRMVDGAAVETFAGSVSYPDGTSALFQADRPLPPASDFMITAFRAGVDGSPIGDTFTSAFTTGALALAPLAMASEPTFAYEEADRKRHTCSADACGKPRCETSDELVHLRSLRVAVPEITGGVTAKPYRVWAELVATFAAGQAPAVATTDIAATQADRRSYFVLDLPALPASAEGCVTVRVQDVAGHSLDSKPVCMKFDADGTPQPADSDALGADSQIKISTYGHPPVADDTELDELGLSTSSDAITASPALAEASAGGCTIGRSGGAGALGWLGLALTLARLRPRKRSASVTARRAA
jgi:hypothetical protein